MCVSVYKDVHVDIFGEESVGSPGAELTGNCEPPEVVPGAKLRSSARAALALHT